MRDLTCSICYAPFDPLLDEIPDTVYELGPSAGIPVCNSNVSHTFHLHCIRDWCTRRSSNECPICRGPLNRDGLARVGVQCASNEESGENDEDGRDEHVENVITEMYMAGLHLYNVAAREMTELGVVNIFVGEICLDVRPTPTGGIRLEFPDEGEPQVYIRNLTREQRFSLMVRMRLGVRKQIALTTDELVNECLYEIPDETGVICTLQPLDPVRDIVRHWNDFNDLRQCAIDVGYHNDTIAHYDVLEETRIVDLTDINIDVVNESGHTPLYVAAVRGNEYLVQEFVQHDADPDLGTHGSHYETALFYVTRDADDYPFSSRDIARMLVDAGANVQMCLNNVPSTAPSANEWRQRLMDLL